MVKLLARLSLLTVIFAVLLILLRVIGGWRTDSLVDAFTEISLPNGQKLVCWHSICPGLTSAKEAESRLNADTTLMRRSVNGSPCWGDSKKFQLVCPESSDGQVEELFISYSYLAPRGPQLGDMVAWWGNPVKSSIGPLCTESHNLFDNNVLAWTYDLSFQRQLTTVSAFQLEAHSRIVYLRIFAPTAQIDISSKALTRWRGFASFQGPYVGCGH